MSTTSRVVLDWIALKSKSGVKKPITIAGGTDHSLLLNRKLEVRNTDENDLDGNTQKAKRSNILLEVSTIQAKLLFFKNVFTIYESNKNLIKIFEIFP
jgi:hypothetical protein